MSLRRKIYIVCNRIRFRYKNIKFGSDLRICDHLYIKLKGHNTIEIGDGFAFSSGSDYNPLARNIRGAIELEDGASITIGNNVGISSSCLWIFDHLKIGDNTKIGADCILLDSDAHSLDYLERMSAETDRPNAKKAGITIGENCLIGTRCIILKGVTIGSRSIIGSGSVVTKSIPPDCIAAGNPCKVIKKNNKNNNE